MRVEITENCKRFREKEISCNEIWRKMIKYNAKKSKIQRKTIKYKII